MALAGGSTILLSVAGACVLLAEAMLAVAYARSWRLTWWEWHLLMLAAFGAIAWSARREEREERFSDLYLDHTAAGTREVSVLFADLAGFTRFAEGRRPPRGDRDAQHLLRGCDSPHRGRGREGQIDRLIGDAIMATWGTRGDQPDHAERAVRAAAALQAERTTRIAEEHPDWPRFRVCGEQRRCTGRAWWAPESGKSYTVIGDTVNVAARLEGRGAARRRGRGRSDPAGRARPAGDFAGRRGGPGQAGTPWTRTCWKRACAEAGMGCGGEPRPPAPPASPGR